MTGQLPVAHGFIAESFLKRTAIVPTNGHRKICLGMVGDFRGRMIAASFITVPRRARMEHLGANVRSWSGGTKRRRNGRGWTILIIRRTLPQILQMT